MHAVYILYIYRVSFERYLYMRNMKGEEIYPNVI